MNILEQAKQSLVHVQQSTVPYFQVSVADYFTGALNRATLEKVPDANTRMDSWTRETLEERGQILRHRMLVGGVPPLVPYEVTGFETPYQVVFAESLDRRNVILSSYTTKLDQAEKRLEEVMCVVAQPEITETGICLNVENPFWMLLKEGKKIKFENPIDEYHVATSSINDSFNQYFLHLIMSHGDRMSDPGFN